MIKYIAVAVAVAVAVSGGGAVAVAGLTKRFFNHIQKDFLINVWVYVHSLLGNGPISDERPDQTGPVTCHPAFVQPYCSSTTICGKKK